VLAQPQLRGARRVDVCNPKAALLVDARHYRLYCRRPHLPGANRSIGHPNLVPNRGSFIYYATPYQTLNMLEG
jgi:hypothetical protein